MGRREPCSGARWEDLTSITGELEALDAMCHEPFQNNTRHPALEENGFVLGENLGPPEKFPGAAHDEKRLGFVSGYTFP